MEEWNEWTNGEHETLGTRSKIQKKLIVRISFLKGGSTCDAGLVMNFIPYLFRGAGVVVRVMAFSCSSIISLRCCSAVLSPQSMNGAKALRKSWHNRSSCNFAGFLKKRIVFISQASS